MRRFWRYRRGQATVLMVVMMVVLMGGAALTVDVGAAYSFKQRCDAVVEAAALAGAGFLPNASAARAAAEQIVTANGLSTANVTITTPYLNDVSKVQVTYGDDQPTYFARTLGISLFRISTQAIARQGGPACFDYAIFSGSTFDYLDIGGATINVTGHVHGNENVRIRGATLNVTGQIDASGIVDVKGSDVTAGNIVNYMPVIDMPAYDSVALRAASATVYVGSQHWSGVTVNVEGNIFVQGDLKLSGVTIIGKGSIICSGNIELAGTGLYYATSDAKVCIYGMKDIQITGASGTKSFDCHGILYAPTGTIDGHGLQNFTINGAVVADLHDFSGVNMTVNHDIDAKNAFFGGYSSLTR